MLPALGGYGEYALASSWTAKPASVSWADAAALPASAAAAGTLRQLRVAPGETLLILGGGSVGLIAAQLALSQGATVIGATGASDEELARELGAVAVRYVPELLAHAQADKVDAVLDAAGEGGLGDAVALADGPARVITLADEHASDFGLALSAPTPGRAPDASTRPCRRWQPANSGSARSGSSRCGTPPERTPSSKPARPTRNSC
jgi:NADPH:quinone reductase-like Zn-dependent oxidoreductase